MRTLILGNLIPMDDPYGQIIAACWAIFVIVWFIAAFFTKRTVERSASFFRLVWIAAVIALVATAGRGGGMLWERLPKNLDVVWSDTPTVGLAAAAVTAIGLLITLWARFTLGSNWSGTVTFKENHELITGGPYAFARHPIYTGLLTMLLGTVIISGHAFGFAILALGTLMLWLKSLDEERMMIKHFPDAYPPYKQRVRALIPFVL
jgi:protein-S-isoprenylcysteine O-methyltransferase Ste14